MHINHVSNRVWSKSVCKAKTKCPMEIIKINKPKVKALNYKDKYISPEKYNELVKDYNKKVNELV